MSIIRNFLKALFLFLPFSIISSAISQDNLNATSKKPRIAKAKVVAISPDKFTRIPITEEHLNRQGCKFEISQSKKIDDLTNIISDTIQPDSSNSAEPTNLRTAIYLYGTDGSTYRYLFNASNTKGIITGTLIENSTSSQITAKSDLIDQLKTLAGPDTLDQRFSDTCLN
ncbi:hypothetical protein [Massilia sp. CFBP9026]|uniref:hypothetical protein n=1 Tax=Massilia sp. CFBP9026 TaxID=3096536 RepID=UPI002A6A214F|nr:hypothetical protein [Massilia sp. CFBP9026]MDY0965418.1 hypothetical protein [Massilia sp. CFBP9026]